MPLVKKLESGQVDKSKIFEKINAINDVCLELNKDLTKYSTMRLVAQGDLITVSSEEALKELLPVLSSGNLKYRAIGWGANQLLPKTSEIPYLNLAFSFDKSYLDEVRDEYDLPASVSLAVLSSHAVKNGLKGWDVFTGIPASLGGAIFMNAGTNLGEIGAIVKEVRIIKKDGGLKTVTIDKKSFSYRKNSFVEDGDIIVSAKLTHLGQYPEITTKIKDYLALRNRTQPLKESTCGCIFKNKQSEELICRAGMFIDIIGMKGFTHNNIQISPKHANFMVNLGGANFEDICKTIEMVKKELQLQYGVDFETEVKLG